MEISQKFEAWAVVELMGHQKIAGHVTEMVMGGSSMLRVDVPETKRIPAFTRIFNPSALYAINPCTEEFAKKTAESIQAKPILEFDMQVMINKMAKAEVEKQLALPEKAETKPLFEEDFDDEDDEENYELAEDGSRYHDRF